MRRLSWFLVVGSVFTLPFLASGQSGRRPAPPRTVQIQAPRQSPVMWQMNLPRQKPASITILVSGAQARVGKGTPLSKPVIVTNNTSRTRLTSAQAAPERRPQKASTQPKSQPQSVARNTTNPRPTPNLNVTYSYSRTNYYSPFSYWGTWMPYRYGVSSSVDIRMNSAFLKLPIQQQLRQLDAAVYGTTRVPLQGWQANLLVAEQTGALQSANLRFSDRWSWRPNYFLGLSPQAQLAWLDRDWALANWAAPYYYGGPQLTSTYYFQ